MLLHLRINNNQMASRRLMTLTASDALADLAVLRTGVPVVLGPTRLMPSQQAHGPLTANTDSTNTQARQHLEKCTHTTSSTTSSNGAC